MQAGHRWLADPSAIYAETAKHLALTGLVPVTGLIKPPGAAMLAAPFSLLPGSWEVPAWTVADALAAVVGLLIVQRYLTRMPLERAVFWAVALYCPPLYAEVNAGQIGGFSVPLAASTTAWRETPAALAGGRSSPHSPLHTSPPPRLPHWHPDAGPVPVVPLW